MKRFGVLSTAALLLLLGSTASAYARQEQHEQEAKPENKPEAKPAKQEAAKPENKPEAKPAKQEETKPVKQEAAKPEKQQEAKPAKQEDTKSAKQDAAKPEKQQEAKGQPEQAKSNNQQQAQRTPAEEQRQRAVPALRLSARGSSRIPDDRFRANFGREHVFVISQPEMVGGYSRFQYGGFWFGFVQPWPVGWYYTDDVYVDYIDGGYYLYNPYYPDTRVSISVVL
jgi:outer membrane biosynthesis protein TonB